jgi:hypothetical protein
MIRFRRITCVLLVVLLLGTLIGCSGEEISSEETTTSTATTSSATEQKTTTTQATTTTKAEATTTEIENPFAERFEISWLTANCLHYVEGRWDELELEEKFNVDLKVWNIDNHNTEQIVMMLAAGDFPNFAQLQYWDTGFLYDSKLIRTVKRDMLYKYIPTLARYLDEEPFAWNLRKVTDTEDEYYGILWSTPQDTFPWTYTMFRLDWLENLGYDFDDLYPVDYEEKIFITNRQFTFEEFNDILEAFTVADPDGNGEDDTYGYLYTDQAEMEGNLTGMWGYIPHSKFIYKDPTTGDYVDYRGYTGMRDFWEWIFDQIHKGYVRKAPASDYNTMLAVPNVGHINPPAFAVRSAMEAHQISPPNPLLRENPDITLVITPPTQGPSGEGNMYIRTFTKWTGYLCYIGADTTDAQMARLLQLLEYTCFDREASLRYSKGIEGIHYTWEGEPIKSRLIITDPSKVPPKYASPGAAFERIFNPGVFTMTMYEYLGVGYRWTNYLLENYWRENEWFEKYGLVPDKNADWGMLGVELQDKFNEINWAVAGSVNTVYNEFKQRVFQGQVANMRSEWSQYIDALYAAGYDKLVEIYGSDEWPLTTELYKGSRWIK